MDSDTLLTLGIRFAILSLFAVGGVNAGVPEMHRIVVHTMHWINERQFTDIFAIAQAAPGPNVIIVTLIGYHVMGFAGAAVATAAMCVPSCLCAFFVGRIWDRFKTAPWRVVIQTALVPVSVGLIASSAFLVAQGADRTWIAGAITLMTAVVTYWTRISPLWMFAASGSAGLFGLV